MIRKAIRRAIVRAAPTCTLWSLHGLNYDMLLFTPFWWVFERTSIRYARWAVITRREYEDAR